MTEKTDFKIGSRRSQLALIQTRHVIGLLKEKFPKKTFDIVSMVTLGDKILDKPLPKIGEKSLFTKELENALFDASVDFVVHSLKDLPTVLPKGLVIGAILEREDPRDALIIRKGLEVEQLVDLAPGSVVGTSSLRRSAQLRRKHPQLAVEDIRGNLNTRLNKLDSAEKYSALVLAHAGLVRMGWQDRVSQVLEADEIMYAVGQGALAVECREGDKATLSLLKELQHQDTLMTVLAERSFLRTLGGGCSAPVAVASTIAEDGQLTLVGAVWSLDGSSELRKSASASLKSGPPKSKCPFLADGPAAKRRRLSSASSAPAAITKVGFDFMGKCPYLENHPEVGAELGSCPFLNNTLPPGVAEELKAGAEGGDCDPFCGISSSGCSSSAVGMMEQAARLGAHLAAALVDIGAAELIEESQAKVRSS